MYCACNISYFYLLFIFSAVYSINLSQGTISMKVFEEWTVDVNLISKDAGTRLGVNEMATVGLVQWFFDLAELHEDDF